MKNSNAAKKTTTPVASGVQLPPEVEQSKTRNILENTIILRVRITKCGFIKKLTKAEKKMLLDRAEREKEQVETVETKAQDSEQANNQAGQADTDPLIAVDHEHLRMAKELIDLDALRPIRALDAQFKKYLSMVELKNSIVGGGAHLIPLAYLQETLNEIDKYKIRRKELVGLFVEKYPELKAEQIAKDPELFRVSEYPTTDEVESKFDVDYDLKSDEIPRNKLASLSDMQLRKELEKVESKWKDVGSEIMDAMRAGLGELVMNAVEQLGSDDGKPKVFRNTLVEKVNRFIETFGARNAIVGDTELPKLVEELRQAMAGVTPDSLRKNEETRQRVKAVFDQVAGEMKDKNMIVVRRRRLLEDPDDEE